MNNADIDKTKSFVKYLNSKSKPEVIHTTKAKQRVVVDPIEDLRRYDIHSLPQIFSDTIRLKDFDYGSDLKVLSISYREPLKILGARLCGANCKPLVFSHINPAVFLRYKTRRTKDNRFSYEASVEVAIGLSKYLTMKLIGLELLKPNDILSVGEDGSYMFLSRKNIYMIVRYFKPTLYGLLILLALTEEVIILAFSAAKKNKVDFNFNYFMVLVGHVLNEKFKNTPIKYKLFTSNYSEVMSIIVDLRLGNQPAMSMDTRTRIRLGELDLDHLKSYSRQRMKQNDSIRRERVNEIKNEKTAEAVLLFEEMSYSPAQSREERVFLKSGVNLGGVTNLRPRISKKNSDAKQFKDLLEQYKDGFVKDSSVKD